MRKEIKILSRQKHIILNFNSFQTNKAFLNFHKSIRGFKKDLMPNIALNQGRRHRNGRGGHALPPLSPLFCVAKRKKGDKGKKERVSKQKLLKGCHQG